ncbi:MAG: putative quinol monooxygenase [Actinomycetota bacterium]|nr:putative quinol monooxygenase [Actinomycetota bacterium]
MSKTAVLAKITAQPGKRDELVSAMGELVAHVENEPGTEVYALNLDAGDENVVWFYEVYADKDALKAHSGSDVMKKVGGAMAPLLAGRPELTMLTLESGKGVAV